MPSGLFKKDADHWVFSGPVPPSFNGYMGDHANLLVRYMFQLTPEEQRALAGPNAVQTVGGGSNQSRGRFGGTAGTRKLSSFH